MLGSSILVAPITNGQETEKGDSRKNNLYLPDHRTMWIDLFTGQKYIGGRVYNKLTYPTWHLPVFVRGALFLILVNETLSFILKVKVRLVFMTIMTSLTLTIITLKQR